MIWERNKICVKQLVLAWIRLSGGNGGWRRVERFSAHELFSKWVSLSLRTLININFISFMYKLNTDDEHINFSLSRGCGGISARNGKSWNISFKLSSRELINTSLVFTTDQVQCMHFERSLAPFSATSCRDYILKEITSAQVEITMGRVVGNARQQESRKQHSSKNSNCAGIQIEAEHLPY